MNSRNLFLVGLNHLSAQISCREKATVPAAELPETLRYLQHAADLAEVAVLSTCSRVEVLGVSTRPEVSASRVRAWYENRLGEGSGGLLRELRGGEAVRHLVRVTAGLDSWILGESEIQGQVKQAYHCAESQAFTGRVLNRVFQEALRAGKMIRAQTGIQNGISSIGGAAALVARRIFGASAGGRTVLFGAGQAGEAVARHLAAKDFTSLVVANRSQDRARTLAQSLKGEAVSLEEGLRLLGSAEIGIFSTSAASPLLTASALSPSLRERRRPLFLIDLGSPRNVEAACGSLEGAFLYDLDDLKELLKERMAAKSSVKMEAENLAARLAERTLTEVDKPGRLPAVLQPAGQ